MRVLVAEEKHGTRILAAETDEKLEASAKKLIQERLDQAWYDDIEAAETALNGTGLAWDFLEDRAAAEYENVHLEEVEEP